MRIRLATLLFLPVFFLYGQTDSLTENHKSLHKFLNKLKEKGDSAQHVNFYFSTGPAIPVFSFSRASTMFNNFGKAFCGYDITLGADLFLYSNFTAGVEFERTELPVLNKALTEHFKNNPTLIAPPTPDHWVTYPAAFDVVVKTFGFGLSRIFYFDNFSLQLKIIPSAGSLRYDYIILTGPEFSGTAQCPNFGSSPMNYTFEPSIIYMIKESINCKYRLLARNKFLLHVSGGLSYFQAKPLITMYKSYGPFALISLKDKISILSCNIGINLTLRKTRTK